MNSRSIVITPTDISLMHVAAREYGDARFWVLIAQANRLADCMIGAIATVVLPSTDNVVPTGLAVL